MSNQEATKEPSMEEILASIRQIISDDDEPQSEDQKDTPEAEAPESDTIDEADLDALFADATGEVADDAPDGDPTIANEKAPEPDESPKEEENSDEDDVLELTEDFQDNEPADLVEPEIDIDFADASVTSEPEAAPDDATFMQVEDNDHQEPDDDYAEDHHNNQDESPMHFSGENLLSPQSDQLVSGAFGDLANTILANNARTLDDLVQDMLKPMLKNWLDENLPPLVERLVRAEIERVSRGTPKK